MLASSAPSKGRFPASVITSYSIHYTKLYDKNVLICVDGSPECARVADHVGFMLRDEPGHDVSLLNVGCAAGDQEADVFQEPMQMLLDNGFPRDRIDARCIPKGSPAKAILAESKNYAVVAMGRSAGP